MKINKKKTMKISIISIIVFLLIILLSNIILNADEKKYQINSLDYSGSTYLGDPKPHDLTVNGNIYFDYREIIDDNLNVYCAESGTDLPDGFATYQVHKKISVTDPILLYILSLEDLPKSLEASDYTYTDPSTKNSVTIHGNYKVTDVKQNLIWWYLNTYSANTDAKKIQDAGATTTSGAWNMTDTFYSNTYAKTFKQLQQEAINYATMYSNKSISIESMTIDGDYVKVTITGYFDTYNIYINNDTNKISAENYTVVSDTSSNNKRTVVLKIAKSKFTGSSANVKVDGKIRNYDSTIFVMYNTNTKKQKLIAVFNEGQTYDSVKEISDKLDFNTNVSLQKYITKVTSSTGTVKYNDTTTRKNKYADTDTNLGITGYNHSEKNISKDNSVSGVNNYKSANPVQIEIGDTVEYTITVYNNSNVDATVDIKDTINNKATVKSGITNGYIADDLSLAAGSSKTFTVTAKYDTYTSNILDNKAYISACSPTNEKTYRTYDEDYVRMKNTNVSLQKYITKVNGANITTTNTSLTSRANTKTATDESNTGVKDKITPSVEAKNYKKSNPVKISIDDTVTYRIYVYNNSNVNAKEVSVSDQLPYYTDSNGEVKSYASIESITMTKDGNTTQLSHNGTDIKNGWIYERDTNFPNKYRYVITDLKANTSVYFDITVKFAIHTSNILTNMAWIDSTTPDNTWEYRSVDKDYIQMPNADVSMQKYITKVNGTKVSGRENKYANSDKNLFEHGLKHENVDVSKNNKVTGVKSFKRDNPVEIEAGDTVTYRIYVYNNSAIKAKTVTLRDAMPRYTDAKGNVQSYTEIVSIYYNGGTTDIKSNWKVDDTKNTDGTLQNHNTIIYTINNLAGGSSVYFDITLKYTSYVDDTVLVNSAWISSVPTNTMNYRTVDADYIKMKKYEVSLEKYVTQVTDKDGGNKVTYNNRSGKRYNSDETNESTNKNVYKPNNEVLVEPGDIVTYTIRLKNTGATGDPNVKINKIYDSFTYSQDNQNNLSKGLVYNSTYGIQGNGGGKISNYYYGNDKDNANKSLNRYLIEFDNPTELKPGEYVDVTIQFKVEISKSLTVAEQELFNRAVIVGLKNRNNVSVEDSDGTGNNKDADYIKTKLYKVSLEKFVTQVTDKDGNNSIAYNDRSGKRHNQDLADGNENKNTYKKDTKVLVEAGDIVTFTIRLKNEGDTQVKITKIWDTAISKSSGLKLALVDKNGKTEGLGNTINLDIYDKNGKKTSKVATLNTTGKYRGPNNNLAENWDQYSRYEINFEGDNAVLLNEEDYIDVKIRFKVIVPQSLSNTEQLLYNKSAILNLANRNNVEVLDSDGTDDNADMDFLENKLYKVSLEKYVSKVNNQELTTNRDGDDSSSSADKSEHKYDNVKIDQRRWKYNNPVTVSNGNKVTYTIKVKNDGDTVAKITKITDYLPNGVKYNNKEYTGTVYCTEFGDGKGQTGNKIEFTTTITLNPGKTYSFDIEVEVIEPNISNNILKNVAEINSIKNRNDCDVLDVTTKNNKDADYIQLDYIQPNPDPDVIISGHVWNDIAKDKGQNKYNGLRDEDGKALSNIKVMLYRNGVNKPISTKNTDENGYYSFGNSDIDAKVITKVHERFIKGPKKEGTDRWVGTYYSYYVVFEYDGVKYTSTPDGKAYENIINSGKDYKLDSNAREKTSNESFNGKVESDRTSFNNKFNPIPNQNVTINYDPINEEGYIPQSKHQYDSNTMRMQSSTELISFEDLLKDKDYSNKEDLQIIKEIEDKIKHIGLGLRGRDIFDLELISDVYKVTTKVNGQTGEYNYTNKVGIRNQDIRRNNINSGEDMANIKAEESNSYVLERNGEEGQQIRETDLNTAKTNANAHRYDNDTQGLKEIKVTYKITVTNASQTDGIATVITNYYDKCYSSPESARLEIETKDGVRSSDKVGIENKNERGTSYNKVNLNLTEAITELFGDNMLTQSQSCYVYVTYKMDVDILKEAFNNNGELIYPTYNMAEVAEYKTKCGNGQTEHTRGLIDKDSAPNSVESEKVRLTNGIGDTSTAQYYFNKTELNKLKYEDDTYATPTLYFTSSDNLRTIEGIVFEDKTTTDSATRVKTGDGVKLDANEVGIYGATVELVELNTSKDPSEISRNEGIVRYKVKTNRDGKFTIKGFLPGYYVIRYHYGDTPYTSLLHMGGDGINKQSYNGEDYQATNNTGSYGSRKLSETPKTPYYWYLENEGKGISTGTDNLAERGTVSRNVIDFTDEEMTILNNMRDMVGELNEGVLTATKKYNLDKTELLDIQETRIDGIYDIMDDTQMYATTPQMLFDVEKPIIEQKEGQVEVKQNTVFSEYIIKDMNFGIAEVPVTTIDLQKNVNRFILTDATGQKTIAGISKNAEGNWVTEGNVLVGNTIDVSVEDELLQGAKLQITYGITSKIDVEKNFDGKDGVIATITGIVDFIDNNLSYNEALGENSKYWEITTIEDVKAKFAKMQYKEGTIPQGTVDPDGTKYSTIVKAKPENPILTNKDGTEMATITLEKVLSSTDSTFEDIIESTVDIYEYNNTIEITTMDYSNSTPEETEEPRRDLVRTEGRYIPLPGVQHDSASAKTIGFHPPTGDSSMDIRYLVIAVISLIVLAAGIFGIKKFVLNKD